MNPPDDDKYKGAYPIVFHAPDFGCYDALQLPVIRNVQIAAFAHELSAFADDEEYFASQAEAQVKYAAEFFLPTGTFPPKDASERRYVPYARFAGHIIRTSLLTNPVTNLPFHWAHIRTYGGEYDVIADPEALKGTLVVGGVVSGGFWLSGQIITGSEDRVIEQSVADFVQAANVRTD